MIYNTRNQSNDTTGKRKRPFLMLIFSKISQKSLKSLSMLKCESSLHAVQYK